MKKRLIAFSMLLCMVLSLIGCGKTAFVASEYVKACLDASFHEEYEEYAEFIGSTVEDVKADIDKENQNALDEMVASFNTEVPEEQKQEFMALLMELQHLTKYEVLDAQETEDGYFVPVTIYPVNAYEKFLTGIEDKFLEAANNGTLTEETIFPIMLEYFAECVHNAEYKDTIETNVNVIQDAEGIWYIPEDTMHTLEEMLIPGI